MSVYTGSIDYEYEEPVLPPANNRYTVVASKEDGVTARIGRLFSSVLSWLSNLFAWLFCCKRD